MHVGRAVRDGVIVDNPGWWITPTIVVGVYGDGVP